jgi:hypothetical protein
MTGAKTKSELPASPIESAHDRCERLEQQLSETQARRYVALKAVESAGSAEDLARARSDVDFLEVRAKALTQQRIDLEEDRLGEVAAEAGQRYADAAQPLSAAISELSQLQRKIAALEPEVSRRHLDSQEAFRAKHEAETAVRLFRSACNGIDQAKLQAHLTRLRVRLQSLGSAS